MSGAPAPLVRSPLLIARRARSAGGTGGRRVELFPTTAGGYRVRVTGDVSREAVAATPLAAVQQYNGALRDAARAGLTAAPEPAALTVEALRRAQEPAGG